MNKIRLCAVGDLTEGNVVNASSDPPIAVYLIEGQIYATSNLCSHGNSLLSDGYVDGDRIECALHLAQFCIKTGKVAAPPATTSVAVYPVEVVDGVVYTKAPSS
ncbi:MULTISPECIES: non-heme iron oxygenase ferredoxin subunit [unclassified Rhodococcus (in: high G+C Gram-positive bacteria)]|uniref:non-heme iron oxygenase ferredoxin subunit n=1 Tax=unclassified Rhodococcus (in: high G+C Gram-positive bacteria) TaxID=192944 RepID=UPI0020CCACC7|nr:MULTISPECIES: non-heme iron oxygenase ferredoxin subunit [unclassified Rhodococcus (in: high G+C Gram-positive bacteria)]